MNGRRDFWIRVGLVLVGAVVLLWMALWNRYPLVYSDSGTYLWSAAQLIVPVDRAVGYGLFVRTVSLAPTLWVIVLAQAVATSYLLLRVGELILGKTLPQVTGRVLFFSARSLVAFGVVAATALVTAAAQFVGWVMPDVFASWMLLGVIVLWLAPTRWERAVAVLLLEVALLVHSSHILVAAGTLGIVAVGVLIFVKERIRAARVLAPVALVLLGVVPLSLIINVWLGAGATLGRGGYTFVLNRLNETGILEQTLNTYCGEKGWALCGYREALAAHKGEVGWFLWSLDSPLQVTGWDSSDPEQGAIVQHALRCCLAQVVSVSAHSSVGNFWNIQRQNDLWRLDDKSETQRALRELYPQEFAAFLASGQEQNNPPVPLLPLNDRVMQIAWLSAAVILLIVAARRRDRVWILVWFAMFTLLIVNAIVTGSLSGPYTRYQARVFWLVPYFVLLEAAALALGYRAAQRLGRDRITAGGSEIAA